MIFPQPSADWRARQSIGRVYIQRAGIQSTCRGRGRSGSVAPFYVIWGGLAVTVLVVERTPELMRLHQKIIDAVTPFSVSGGTAAAFVGAVYQLGTYRSEDALARPRSRCLRGMMAPQNDPFSISSVV